MAVTNKFLELYADYGGSSGFALDRDNPEVIDIFHKIEAITIRYRLKLEDISSNEYILISYLSKVDDLELLKKIIDNLYLEDFVADMFERFTAEAKNISVGNIIEYIDKRREYQIKDLRLQFSEKDYKNRGNFFLFIYKDIMGYLVENPFLSDSLLNLNYRSYISKPMIDYIKSGNYRSYPEAEKDYWNIVENYALANDFVYGDTEDSYGMLFNDGEEDVTFTDHFGYTVVRDILALLMNKNFRKSIYGQPVLIQKDISKMTFSDFRSDDLNIIKVITKDYSRLYKDEFFLQLDQMFEKALDYKLLNEHEWDEDDFLEDFLNFRLDELSLDYDSIDKLKEIKFYRLVLAQFLGKENDSYDAFDIETDFISELDFVRGIIENLVSEIRIKGYFIQ